MQKIIFLLKLKGVIFSFLVLKPFGIAVFTASPLSEESPYSRLLWEFLFRGSAANPTIAQSRFYLLFTWIECFKRPYLRYHHCHRNPCFCGTAPYSTIHIAPRSILFISLSDTLPGIRASQPPMPLRPAISVPYPPCLYSCRISEATPVVPCFILISPLLTLFTVDSLKRWCYVYRRYITCVFSFFYKYNQIPRLSDCRICCRSAKEEFL